MVPVNLWVGWVAIFGGLVAGTAVGLFFHQPEWLDGHTPDVFDEVYRFAEESELFDVQITIQTPFPGTPLYRRLKRENRLLADGSWRRCTLFDVNYRPEPMTAGELAEGFRRLAVRLYSEELTKWRRENFNRKYLRPADHEPEVDA